MGGIVEQILDLEWEMFQETQNVGGRASCQDDRETFYRMRRSQWKILSKTVLELYYRDLCEARSQGRNMVAEKYGYMMESYDPEGFAEIQSLLPLKSERELELVEEILGIYMGWHEELGKQIPGILSSGRPIRSEEDKIGDVSIETYQRGELKTYSEATLDACLLFLGECKREGRNPVEENYQEMVKAYGYKNLSDAEQQMREKDKEGAVG